MNLNELFEIAVREQGSDLHLVVGTPPVLRVNGTLKQLEKYPALDEATMEELLSSLYTEEQYAALRGGHEIEFSINHKGIRFACVVFQERGNLSASLRLKPLGVPTLEELLPGAATLPLFRELISAPRGLLVVTGQVGSGKTTLCAGLIEEINRTRVERIMTIENPIEYYFESKQSVITQREIGTDAQESPNAVRSVQRSDPDVVYISDLDSLETLALTLSLAETGHLVITSLSVESVSAAVRRLSEAFPESQQGVIRERLSRVLIGVIAQRLVMHAKEPRRLALHEILLNTPAMRQYIADGTGDLTLVMEAGREDGMQTMDRAIKDAIERGEVAPETT